MQEKIQQISKTPMWPIIVALMVFIFISVNPIYFVPSGQKAVIQRFGIVRQEIINEGMHIRIPFIDSVIMVNVTPQNIPNEVQTYTRDNQPIDVKFNILFTNPVNDIANTVIRYNKQPYSNFAEPKINDAFKAVAGKYTASEFVTERERIRLDFLMLAKQAVINDSDGKPVINILDLPITNVDFDDEYERAIKDKQVAQQTAQKALYDLQKAKIDSQSQIAKAEGEARSLTIKAQAIAKNPQVVRLNEIEKWDGHFPLNAKVIGGGATIVDAK